MSKQKEKTFPGQGVGLRLSIRSGVLALVILLAGTAAWAKVAGPCVNCHTMHESQDGSAVAKDFGGTGMGPQESLLNTDCVGCHSSNAAATIDLSLGGGTRIPIVYNTGGTAQPLAGGNFYWLATSGDGYGHNVKGIDDDGDAVLTGAPGMTQTLGCATDQCHGTMSLDSPDIDLGWGPIPGTGAPAWSCRGCHDPQHHADDSAPVVDASGGYYRYLASGGSLGGGSHNRGGVIGIEDDDWEQTVGPADHNVYFGRSDVYMEGTPTVQMSTGMFCSGCHGNFHHDMNEGQAGAGNDVSGAWLRHPSDVIIPSSGEYSGYVTYDPVVPVAVPDLAVLLPGQVRPGTDLVTCISCHRAHGSPYPNMLRWDYSADCDSGTANGGCGCFACHTTKDD